MKPLRKIALQRVPTIREEVFKHIRQRILSGEAAPGAKLIEGKLAQDLGTSRTPVREALHKLEMEGLIESIPRVGYRVREVTEEEVEEIIELRVVLETLAAKRASGAITDAEVDRLERTLALAERCIDKRDARGIVDCNTKFHDGICKASRSRRIQTISLTLRDHMLRFRNMGSLVAETAQKANEDHRRILDAIRQRDDRAIEKSVRSHLAWTKEDIIRNLRHSANPKPSHRPPSKKAVSRSLRARA